MGFVGKETEFYPSTYRWIKFSQECLNLPDVQLSTNFKFKQVGRLSGKVAVFLEEIEA